MKTTRRTYNFRYPPAEYFVEYYGPTVRAFAALEPEGRNALAQDLEEPLESRNISGDETLIVPSSYLEVVAVRR